MLHKYSHTLPLLNYHQLQLSVFLQCKSFVKFAECVASTKQYDVGGGQNISEKRVNITNIYQVARFQINCYEPVGFTAGCWVWTQKFRDRRTVGRGKKTGLL